MVLMKEEFPGTADSMRAVKEWFAFGQFPCADLDAGPPDRQAAWTREVGMDGSSEAAVPEDLRDGDVLVYMSGRLLVVDHLVPEAFAIDLVELHEGDARLELPNAER